MLSLPRNPLFATTNLFQVGLGASWLLGWNKGGESLKDQLVAPIITVAIKIIWRHTDKKARKSIKQINEFTQGLSQLSMRDKGAQYYRELRLHYDYLVKHQEEIRAIEADYRLLPNYYKRTLIDYKRACDEQSTALLKLFSELDSSFPIKNGFAFRTEASLWANRSREYDYLI